MHTNYYQLPPDGVGKKIFARKTMMLRYKNKILDFAEGTIVHGEDSGIDGMVLQIEIFGTTSGMLIMNYTNADNETQNSYIPGELLTVNGISMGYADTFEDFFSNVSNITSFVNPRNGLKVGRGGQAYVRYLEGDQLLDASGKSKISVDKKTGIYLFSERAINKQMSTTINGGAYITYNSGNCVLHTGTTSGDYIDIMTDKFHPVSPDQSLYMEFVMQSGDWGKMGLDRQAGFYYDLNGVFLEIRDLSMCLVTRSNATGSIVDTKICQPDFNIDTVDGNGPSRFILDFTKINKYWIDYSPFNRVRFGTFDDTGNRLTIHIETLSNTTFGPRINASALPLRFEMKNIADTASASEMTIYHTIATLEGDDTQHINHLTTVSNITTVTSGAWMPIISGRPTALKNGNINRTLAVIDLVSVTSSLSSDENIDGRIQLGLIVDSSLEGAVWNPLGDQSDFDFDIESISASGGVISGYRMVKGTVDIPFSSYLAFVDTYLCNKADGTSKTWTIAAKAIKSSCDVKMSINWSEIEVIS